MFCAVLLVKIHSPYECSAHSGHAPDLLLVRHCQTEWNERRLYQGKSDPPLSTSGISAAGHLARELRSIFARPPWIVSSPLARARMTATIVATATNASVRVDERLTELGYGLWEGHTQSTVKQLWPGTLRQWKRAPETVIFPEGESLRQLRDRVRSFLDDRAEGRGPMLAVTHDGVIRIAVLEALNLPLSAFRTVRTTHGALAAFARGGAGVALTAVARVHLADATAQR